MSERFFNHLVKGILPPMDSHLCVGLKNKTYPDVARPGDFQPRMDTDEHGALNYQSVARNSARFWTAAALLPLFHRSPGDTKRQRAAAVQDAGALARAPFPSVFICVHPWLKFFGWNLNCFGKAARNRADQTNIIYGDR